MNRMNSKVDGYLRKAKKWQKELKELRRIVLGCDLTEEVKWRIPCYTFQKRNVVLINGFKEFCALAFVKGALLKDASGILVRPGEHTQAGRMIRFTSVREITALEPVLKAYVCEAIEAEKAGLRVLPKKTPEPIPEELKNKFAKVPALKTAFHALTPGRQRAYVLYFSAAKQSSTRESRIEKCTPRILDGKGMND